MRFSGGSGSGTPTRPRRGSHQTRRGSGETQAWALPDPAWVRRRDPRLGLRRVKRDPRLGLRRVKRDPRLGLAKPTLGLVVSVAVGPVVSVAVGHCLSDLWWMIWVDIYRMVLMMVIKCFDLIFLR
jgi:hypothetical protein